MIIWDAIFGGVLSPFRTWAWRCEKCRVEDVPRGLEEEVEFSVAVLDAFLWVFRACCEQKPLPLPAGLVTRPLCDLLSGLGQYERRL